MRLQKGFTLLEIMLVLALMGIAISIISFTNNGQAPDKQLEQESKRLQVVFDMASDYAVLNQLQMGLLVDQEKSIYTFVHLDEDNKWTVIEGQKLFEEYQLPEEFTLAIELDGLPWQSDDSLFDQEVFDEELSVSNDGVQIGNQEDIEPPPPQVFILSSGDITPFELTIGFEPSFSDQRALYVLLQGQDFTPLIRKTLDEPL